MAAVTNEWNGKNKSSELSIAISPTCLAAWKTNKMKNEQHKFFKK